MLVIRLARGGRNKYPVYRIVAAESTRAATGKFVEVLGSYNPHTKELSLKKEQIENRLKHGAQPSNSVVKLLQREKIELPAWVKLETKNKAPKKEPVEKPEATPDAEAPVAETAASDEASAPNDNTELVTEAATENEAEVSDNTTPAGSTETSETTETEADKAVEGNEAAAEAAEDTAKSA
jgi:small subunit ribosomal protein S16